jgi:hypothetical protein
MAFLFCASLGIAEFGVRGNVRPQELRFVIVKRDRPLIRVVRILYTAQRKTLGGHLY